MRTFTLAMILTAAALAAPGKSVIGTWQGDIKGVRAVTLSITGSPEKLGGTVIMYLIRDDGPGPGVAGQHESPMLDPKLDNDILSFRLKRGDGEVVAFEMKLLGENRGELRRLGDNLDPNFIPMKREK